MSKCFYLMIAVLVTSSVIFADDDFDLYGSARILFGFDVKQAAKGSAKEKPDPVVGVYYDDTKWGPKIGGKVNKENLSGAWELEPKTGGLNVKDLWGMIKVNDNFAFKLGRFGGEANWNMGSSIGWNRKPKKSGGWDYGGNEQFELQFTGGPSKFTFSLQNPHYDANNALARIYKASLTDSSVSFAPIVNKGTKESFIPSVALSYFYKNDMFNVKVGGVMKSFNYIPSPLDTPTYKEIQVTGFGGAVKAGITSGIFGIAVSAVYVLNPAVFNSFEPGWIGLAYEPNVTDKLLGNSGMGFATDIDLKLNDIAAIEVGLGYGFTMMDIDNYENDASFAGYVQVPIKVIGSYKIIPEVGYWTEMNDYKGKEDGMGYFAAVSNQIDF